MPASRVAGPVQLTNAAATYYTVPTGIRFILRHVHIQNPGAAVTLTVSIGANAAGTRLFDAVSIPANSAQDFYYYIPVVAAEIIQALASVTLQLVMVLAGDLEAA